MTRPSSTAVAYSIVASATDPTQRDAHAVAIHFMWYNFAKIHQTLRITPAMAAGVTDRVWDAEDVIALLDTQETRTA